MSRRDEPQVIWVSALEAARIARATASGWASKDFGSPGEHCGIVVREYDPSADITLTHVV
jgi:hypothetical protein